MKPIRTQTTILLDIRFWIILFFLIRLIGITNAPLETGHNWRQSLTNMIARNFLETDSYIFYPRIDMAGDLTGIIGSEFPIFNYLIYLASSWFGFEHWYGRLINLIVSSLGVWFYFLIVRDLINNKTAFISAMILLSSIWFAFSRKIMPDTFSISLTLAGLFMLTSYLRSGKLLSLCGFVLLTTAGLLSKLPAACFLFGLPIIFLFRDISIQRKWMTVLATGFVGLATALWYFVWVPHLVETYRYQLYFPKSIGVGLSELSHHIPGLLEKFYFSGLNSYVGFCFVLVGLFMLIKKKHSQINITLLLITGAFVIFIIKTGSVFPLHNYYIIPFVPVLCLLAATGIQSIPKYGYLVLALVMIEGVINQQHDFFIQDSRKYKLTLETLLDEHTTKDEKIIINGGPSPQDIYFAHRKGWSVDNEILKNEQLITEYKNRGARFLVIDKKQTDQTNLPWKSIYSGRHYAIYDLKMSLEK